MADETAPVEVARVPLTPKALIAPARKAGESQPVKCHAHKKTGVQCKQWAIPGGTVCRYHGGGAPQVRAAAQARLMTMVDPALALMEKAMRLEGKQREKRIEWLQQRIKELRQIIEERGAEFKAAAEKAGETPVAGTTTGHVVRRLKTVGSGPTCTVVDEYEVDTGLLKELREHEAQLRTELTDFSAQASLVKDVLDRAGLKAVDKHEIGGPEGEPLAVKIEFVMPEKR